MTKPENKDPLRKHGRMGRLTVLELMALLAIVGLLATWLLRHWFGG